MSQEQNNNFNMTREQYEAWASGIPLAPFGPELTEQQQQAARLSRITSDQRANEVRRARDAARARDEQYQKAREQRLEDTHEAEASHRELAWKVEAMEQWVQAGNPLSGFTDQVWMKILQAKREEMLQAHQAWKHTQPGATQI